MASPVVSLATVNPERIKSLRRRLELSQHEMAVAVGVTRITITRWEMGQMKPHPIFVEKLKELEQAAREKQKVEAR